MAVVDEGKDLRAGRDNRADFGIAVADNAVTRGTQVHVLPLMAQRVGRVLRLFRRILLRFDARGTAALHLVGQNVKRRL